MWWQDLIVYISVIISLVYLIYVIIKKIRTPKCNMNCDNCPFYKKGDGEDISHDESDCPDVHDMNSRSLTNTK
ncbi:FeoB-associated Cys-rich membrane protein [candidate division KSB1 bacterium]|nr:FeoB-associated Cys-rich membrane protein [candidate division KSB1 bacterium]